MRVREERSRLSGLAHRSFEEIGDAQSSCTALKVGPVQPVFLNQDDAQDVAPLSLRNLIPHPVPLEFLEEDVLGRIHVQPAFGVGGNLNTLPAVHLLFVEGGSSRDEGIDLGRSLIVNQVRAGSLANGPANGLGVHMEPITERSGQGSDVVLGQLNDQVHIQSRPGLAVHSARQRTADQVPDTARLEGLGDDQSDTNRVGNHSQRPAMCSASG
jgi:hypothetical protein